MKKNIIRLLFFLILLFSNTLTKSFSQGKKIDLKEVEVEEKALPVIYILDKGYSFKERDKFMKLLLRNRFWKNDFFIKINLNSFDNKSSFEFDLKGETIVKINNKILSRKHKFKSYRKIKNLILKTESVAIYNYKKNDTLNRFIVEIKTN
tara:strand:- start:1350 stop:1799 length:450 start_codon:yes stop_codon:yes gene_type:complete